MTANTPPPGSPQVTDSVTRQPAVVSTYNFKRLMAPEARSERDKVGWVCVWVCRCVNGWRD